VTFRRHPHLPIAALALAAALAGCTTAPAPVAPAPAPPAPVVPIERKAGWIIRLEQQRVLADPAGGPVADLIALAGDAEPGVRRRAIQAIGRVGMTEGVAAAVAAAADADEVVRAEAVFALGLIGDAAGHAAIITALKDPSPAVRVRAAQGAGLAGATTAGSALVDAAGGCAERIASIEPDDESAKPADVDLCRQIILALVRLKQPDLLLTLLLDPQGQPVSRWWPVAFGLQRSADPRAAGALAALAASPGIYTPAFAIRGLASLKDARAGSLARTALERPGADVKLRAEAIRAIGRSGDAEAVPLLMKQLQDAGTPAVLQLEIIAALGALGDARAFDEMLDLFAHESPAVRAAAMAAAARLNPEHFLLAISSLERDADWSVRVGLANALAGLPSEQARPALEALVDDPDVRVQGPALRAFARSAGDDAAPRILKALEAADFAVRAAAADLVGERRPAGGAAALAAAYTRGDGDANESARAAALRALARYPIGESRETLTRALNDREWPVRLLAASLLRQAGVADAAPARPAPIRQDAAFFESDRVLRPKYTPYAYIELRRGTIQIELDVVNAPLTVASFIDLARAGYFNGMRVHRLIPNFVMQAGDPRGDGAGGPGYLIRDEFSPLPYVRGTVGMALAGPDTGGSQFFIALSPQPHLEGQYTVFGRVISGWETLDQVTPLDLIDRIRIWDGEGSQKSEVRSQKAEVSLKAGGWKSGK